MKVKCMMPVQVYDDGLTGVYAAGQEVEGENAQLLADRYPQYFQSVRPAPGSKKEGKE